MGSKYVSQASSGYNSGPPPDDGSTVAANKITWATIKSKLSDVLKTFVEAVNSQLVTALDTSATTTSVNYTTVGGDHQKPIECTGTITISLGDATTMGAGYQVPVYNKGSGTVTVAVITATDTLNGTVNGTFTLAAGKGATFGVAQSGVGYFAFGGSPSTNPSGNVALPDGVVGTPALTFAADTDTGFYRIGANNIGVTLNGVKEVDLAAGLATFTSRVILTSGNLSFPATQIPNNDANTLDDYEEGTWTPSVGGSATYTNQNGKYVKVGRAIHICCDFTINVIGTGNTTTISNLPFTVGTDSSVNGGFAVHTWSSIAQSIVCIGANASLSSTNITFRIATAAQASLNSGGAVFGNASSVNFAGTYFS